MGGLSFVTARLTHLSENREFGKKHRRPAVKRNSCLGIFWTRDMAVLVECHRKLPNEENQYLAKMHMAANLTLQPHPQRERRLHCFEKSFMASYAINGHYISHLMYSYMWDLYIFILYIPGMYIIRYLASGPSDYVSISPLRPYLRMFSTYVRTYTHAHAFKQKHVHNII